MLAPNPRFTRVNWNSNLASNPRFARVNWNLTFGCSAARPTLMWVSVSHALRKPQCEVSFQLIWGSKARGDSTVEHLARVDPVPAHLPVFSRAFLDPYGTQQKKSGRLSKATHLIQTAKQQNPRYTIIYYTGMWSSISRDRREGGGYEFPLPVVPFWGFCLPDGLTNIIQN